jgi:hypothetical protein
VSAAVKPLDPDSTRGRELAAEMTVTLNEIEEAAAARKTSAHPAAKEESA